MATEAPKAGEGGSELAGVKTDAAPPDDPHAQALALQSALHGILAHTAFVLKARTHARSEAARSDPQKAGLVPEPSLVPLANECQRYKRLCKGLGDWVLNAQATLEAELVLAEAREVATASEAEKKALEAAAEAPVAKEEGGAESQSQTQAQVDAEAIDLDALDTAENRKDAAAVDAIDLTGDSPEVRKVDLNEGAGESKVGDVQAAGAQNTDSTADASASKDPMALLAALGNEGGMPAADSAPLDLSAFEFGAAGESSDLTGGAAISAGGTNPTGATSDDASAAAAALMGSLTGASGADGGLMGMDTTDDQFSALGINMGADMGMGMGEFDLSQLDFGESGSFSAGGDLQQQTPNPGIDGIDFAALLQGFDDGSAG